MPRAESASRRPASPPGYEGDFFAWTQHTAALLREGRFVDVDVAHVAEEIEDMGKRDRRVVEGRLEVLVAHLLQWRYQPRRRSRSWRASIHTQRSRLSLVLRDSPSLKAQLPALLPGTYGRAVALAAHETGVRAERFPRECPYTPEQILDPAFLPTGRGHR
jgi:hypothetical protein